jgi:hypothetical protein
MDIDQLMGMLKTMIDDYQAKADANHKTMLAEINADREKRKANRKADQAKVDANREAMLAEIKADRKAHRKDLKEVKDAMQAMRSELDETIRHRIENAMTNVSRETHKLQTERKKLKKTQVELQTAEVSLDTRARKLEEDLRETKNKLQSRLEAVETKTERETTPVAGASTVQPPTFNGNGPWSVFRRQFEIVAEHNRWSEREKSTHLITALKGRAADVLYGIPTSTTYEQTLRTLEDRFGDQRFSVAYRCQLTSRTQKAGESLQDFATAIEQLAHRAYPTLPEDHVRREAGRAFTYGVKDPDIKIQLLLGGEKTVNEALGQALELQAVLVVARPYQNITKTYGGNRSPPTHRRGTRQLGCWSCEEAGHLKSNCSYGSREDNNQRRNGEFWPPGNKLESPRGPKWRPSNNGGTSRDSDQLSGNGQGPTERSGRRHMH